MSPWCGPVIASEAKQSPGHACSRRGLLRRSAPRNDGFPRVETWRHFEGENGITTLILAPFDSQDERGAENIPSVNPNFRFILPAR
jgi:hypothetical protein